MKELKLSKLENLLFNISGGLSIKYLTKDERKLLKKTYGRKWKSIVYGVHSK